MVEVGGVARAPSNFLNAIDQRNAAAGEHATPDDPVHRAAHLLEARQPLAALAELDQLADSPRDASALEALWDLNRVSIEHELHVHLHSDSNSPLLPQLLSRLVWHARFFCDEVDDPKPWVSRCANLEARRLALQLTEPR